MLPLAAETPQPDPAVIEENPDGLPVIWEVNGDYPGGHSRPMTADEVQQLEEDRAASAAAAAAPHPPALADRFGAVIDAVLNAPDFETAKKQIAAVTGKTGKGT